MIIKTQEDVTPVVVDAYKNIDDARLREIVASLIKHLHDFARDVHLTEEEFQLRLGVAHPQRASRHRSSPSRSRA